VRPDTTIVVNAAWVGRHLTDVRVAIVDTRTEAEYAGIARERLPRTGHIPGARLLAWTRTFTRPEAAEQGDPSPLLPPADLRRLLAEAGAGPGREAVFYCTVGLRAAHLYFVARSLGIPTRLYDGSFADWSARPELPVTRGERP
jgi:thiosulfate/3-mercaptopyruvate sulfurtransferase